MVKVVKEGQGGEQFHAVAGVVVGERLPDGEEDGGPSHS